uniref:Alpha-carbonic anhydrase domain-containing protein n=1 Tax=Seriola lalandi dorsalis TaxID=1841481 RepID=A0A3B4WB83_SERLL
LEVKLLHHDEDQHQTLNWTIIIIVRRKRKYVPLNEMFNVPLDPLLRDYWVYEGSLTTPPCSENVTWILYRYPLTISQLQVKHEYKLQLFSVRNVLTHVTGKAIKN